MKPYAHLVLGVAATAAMLGAAIIGCGSSHDQTSRDYTDPLLPGPIRPPDGSKSVSVLLFTEGKTFTRYEITDEPKDPVSTGFIIPVGQK